MREYLEGIQKYIKLIFSRNDHGAEPEERTERPAG